VINASIKLVPAPVIAVKGKRVVFPSEQYPGLFPPNTYIVRYRDKMKEIAPPYPEDLVSGRLIAPHPLIGYSARAGRYGILRKLLGGIERGGEHYAHCGSV
jgi:hypothetical protein